MAYITNLPIEFIYKIAPTNIAVPSLSIVLVEPTSVTTFDLNGSEHAAAYIAPTVSTEGSYQFTQVFKLPGRWTVLIVDGTDIEYRIYTQYKINIEVPVARSESSFEFPPPL